jgi:hypothetical protein
MMSDAMLKDGVAERKRVGSSTAAVTVLGKTLMARRQRCW